LSTAAYPTRCRERLRRGRQKSRQSQAD